MMKSQSEENDSLVIGNFSATLSAGHAKDLLKGLESLGDQTIFTFSLTKDWKPEWFLMTFLL